MTQKLSLASTSSARKSLLARLGIDFDCAAPDAQETFIENEPANVRASRLAKLKARAIKSSGPNHWILGSDQVAVCDGHILSKPGTTKNAIAQLKHCRGKQVDFYTAIHLHNNASELFDLQRFSVRFRSDLSDEMIENYVHRDNPIYCAGSFKAESLGIALFDSMDGEDINTLVGLPLIATRRLLEQAGFSLL